MLAARFGAILLAIPVLGMSWASAQNVRYYQEGGVTYREVRQVVQRPVVETRMEQRQQTVYRQQVSTQTVPTTRTTYTPVTEYRWEGRWRGTWNPFSAPYLGYDLVPTTRWETRTESVPQTVTRSEVVPQTETVQVPVTSQRMVNEEIVSRTVVPAAPVTTITPAVNVAQGQTVGGISKLENDPPRDTGWRSGQPTISR